MKKGGPKWGKRRCGQKRLQEGKESRVITQKYSWREDDIRKVNRATRKKGSKRLFCCTFVLRKGLLSKQMGWSPHTLYVKNPCLGPISWKEALKKAKKFPIRCRPNGTMKTTEKKNTWWTNKRLEIRIFKGKRFHPGCGEMPFRTRSGMCPKGGVGRTQTNDGLARGEKRHSFQKRGGEGGASDR